MENAKNEEYQLKNWNQFYCPNCNTPAFPTPGFYYYCPNCSWQSKSIFSPLSKISHRPKRKFELRIEEMYANFKVTVDETWNTILSIIKNRPMTHKEILQSIREIARDNPSVKTGEATVYAYLRVMEKHQIIFAIKAGKRTKKYVYIPVYCPKYKQEIPVIVCKECDKKTSCENLIKVIKESKKLGGEV